jgi:hypothetical protein
MFIHFMGRKDEPWSTTHQQALSGMITSLQGIEKFVEKEQENLLGKFRPKERDRTALVKLSNLGRSPL